MISTIYNLDPLTDERWKSFVDRHPDSSVFHTREWLLALQKTYGYVPIAYSTSRPNEELNNAVVFCHVRSWLTGSRLVSLPFSDHCQPLAETEDLKNILESLPTRGTARLKYIEVRPLRDDGATTYPTFDKSSSFSFHRIDLQPRAEEIYKRFHDSCIRRKIKRAERENVTYEAGRSEQLLLQFRYLLLLTRRRHKLPPQPLDWHRNLMGAFGDALTIHMASKDGRPVASILTLTHKKTLVYKYGCSDARYNNLGGTPFLFWKAIQQAKENGAEELDLGRSGTEDPGLVDFKGHLGGIRTELSYYRYPARPVPKQTAENGDSWARRVLVRLPDPAFSFAGRLYRHLG